MKMIAGLECSSLTVTTRKKQTLVVLGLFVYLFIINCSTSRTYFHTLWRRQKIIYKFSGDIERDQWH